MVKSETKDKTEAFEAVRERFPEIFLIVSPPRCCSTALARVFWEHPSIRYYCHEPFEISYFRNAPLEEVAAQLLRPLDLESVCGEVASGAKGLVVKEMPYQVGDHFPILANLATAPIVFLVRDPRLNIASRMARKRQVGDSPIFPLVETGWELLRKQIQYCRDQQIDHVVVTATDLRNRPLDVLPEMFRELGLEFGDEMATWEPCQDVEIDNLEGDHSHLYRKVLRSTGLRPERREPPEVEGFPIEGGFREHVAECLEIYDELAGSPERVSVPS